MGRKTDNFRLKNTKTEAKLSPIRRYQSVKLAKRNLDDTFLSQDIEIIQKNEVPQRALQATLAKITRFSFA